MSTPSTKAHPDRIPSSWSILIAVLLAGSAFLLGRWSVSRDTFSNQRASRPLAESLALTSAIRPASVPPPEVARSTPTEPSWNSTRWSQLRSQSGSVARNIALAQQLEEFARTDPANAMALGSAESNLLLRELLIQAALRGWADVAPAEAVAWAFTLSDASKRGTAMETIFSRAAAKAPDAALQLGKQVFQKDPGGAAGNACALANALCVAGHFEQATQLAADPGDIGPVATSILRAKTYSAWAQLQPESATREASSLRNPEARAEALGAALGSWSQADPAAATQYTAQLTNTLERVQLLGRTLHEWALLDAPAATAWVAANDASLGADDGVAAVAGAGFLKPQVSAEWAASIINPALRSQTVLTLLKTWSQTEPEAARNYFEQTKDLADTDRQQAAALFASPAGTSPL